MKHEGGVATTDGSPIADGGVTDGKADVRIDTPEPVKDKTVDVE